MLATSNAHKDRFSAENAANSTKTTVSGSVDDEGLFMRAMDTLQVPNGHDDGSNRTKQSMSQPARPMDRQFSESFTDHCDQYKSLTSKILAKKGGNRLSGDYSDVDLPPPEGTFLAG